MPNIDASNVTISTEYFDPATGERVKEVDGVEVSRVPALEEVAMYEREAKLEALLALDPAVLDAAVKDTAAVKEALVTKNVLTAKDITDAKAAAIEAEEIITEKP